MFEKIQGKYIPMTETSFFILFSLQQERHGYGIGAYIQELTQNKLVIGPGTMYGTLSKMERDGLICFMREEDKRKFYLITPLGVEILQKEKERIEMIYEIIKEGENE